MLNQKTKTLAFLSFIAVVFLTSCSVENLENGPGLFFQNLTQGKTSDTILNKGAPILNKLSIKSYSSNSITLEKPELLDEGTSAPLINAYIGINGTISYSGNEVCNYLEGPIDAASGDFVFDDLSPTKSYRIVVVAKNSSGYSLKYINPVRSNLKEIDPESYLSMTAKEIGHMKWFFKIADMDLDDFSLIKTPDLNRIPFTGDLQLVFTSHRYTVAFMTYFLAVEQFHKLPACLDIIKPKFDRLIQKMISKKVWSYWASTSRGIPILEPEFDFPYPSQRDPILDGNIMYSGHLGHMIALYEKLYRDMKWSKPGSIVFEWSEDEKYVYNNHSLQKEMYDQMLAKEGCMYSLRA